ncbi:MAG: 4-hydroxythreonine-4-phosphate dehydrogenase PdxA [Planctomycetes bacterium]|nr:4-hydroxythreonine-4-phosphate dehydrogenase PdxA [Planctomycetota bacterium]
MKEILVTPGDLAGVNSRILVPALRDFADRPESSGVTLVVLLPEGHGLCAEVEKAGARVIPLDANGKIEPGVPSLESARIGVAALEFVKRRFAQGNLDGVVTLPISKANVRAAGFDFIGHTDFLASFVPESDVRMAFVSEGTIVVLETDHVPLREVPGKIETSRILKTIELTQRSARRLRNLRKPRIAVLGLNPHAGEQGHLGSEDAEIVAPAVEQAKAAGIDVRGPFPADGFFARRTDREFDATIAMYHDQGLIFVKMLPAPAVNVTLGLPFVRTSPDHGTAYDKAVSGDVEHDSLTESIALCARLLTLENED